MQRADAIAVLEELKALGNPANVAGMARYGINPEGTLGVPVPVLRAMAKRLGYDRALARDLWASGLHEARILAPMLDDPKTVPEEQVERWVGDINSWDICDGFCASLVARTPFAWEKAIAWSARPEEFVKRAGFVLMAQLAVHDKNAADARFLALLPLITREATDERNMVKKAVNWALRQIGKRNPALNAAAIQTGDDLRVLKSRAAR